MRCINDVKKGYFHEFLKMLSLMKNKKWVYLFALILGCTTNATSNILSAFVNKNMISAAETGKISFMSNGIKLALLSFLIGFFIFPFCIYLKTRVIKSVMVSIRLNVFKHIEQLEMSYHESSHSGDLTSTLINDINLIEGAFDDELQIVGVSLIGGISSAIIMFSLDFRLSIITIAIGIISARCNIHFASSLRILGNKIQKSLGILNQHLGDIISGFKVAKMFNIGNIITGRYINESNFIAAQNMKRTKKNSRLNCMNYLLGILSLTGIYILGALMVINKMVDLSTVVAIVGLQKSVNFMFLNLGRFVSELQSTLSGSSRVFDLLSKPSEKERPRINSSNIIYNNSNIIYNNSMIALKNASFSYKSEENLFHNFNMIIPKGKTAALVGASGAGKSSIIKLLMGFYPISSGNIIIDNRLISDYTLKELRELIAYVPQEAYLFDGTIEENIRYGKISATREEIIEAAKKANAHNFIMALSKGYDTKVCESGSNLSGGQKQCLSIARAVLKNAPILLLDEATSALDSESESMVQRSLESIMRGRTVLIIAHRLTTIRNVDTIYVIKSGKISEFGTHDELVGKDGLYKKLFYSHRHLSLL